MKVRYILGISGGKDSAALAIYLKQKYPTMNIEYYNSDTTFEDGHSNKCSNGRHSSPRVLDACCQPTELSGADLKQSRKTMLLRRSECLYKRISF